ncbi:hypothetical protein DB30_05201 [Enhygromyxa salina]|uniref:Uncharacterized protein n=1 Tax=Enhygromyxa salina TaxID=215803 RepID=A0A0C1ZXF8_9BACT|nr:hypothetical protein [Enhygromyxa salina]KIG15783.1 hypothetical protein DB30_05201 [Enhygromyxa salina]
MDPTGLDSLARLPVNAPWAVAVLAAAVAHETASPDEPLTWEGAPPDVLLLANAVARAGGGFGMSRPSGGTYDTECALVLGPNVPCPQVKGRQAFELVRGEDGLGLALAWAPEPEPKVEVYWVDLEDGASRLEGPLEGCCRRIVFDSVMAFEEPELDRNPDGLYLDESAFGQLRSVLTTLTARRARLRADASRRVAELEASIEGLEAAGGDPEQVYAKLEEASKRLDALGERGPWPSIS